MVVKFDGAKCLLTSSKVGRLPLARLLRPAAPLQSRPRLLKRFLQLIKDAARPAKTMHLHVNQ
jgi:hypothetical protein